jgi:hypothetical protein
MVPVAPPDSPSVPPRYNELTFPAFVTTQAVPLVQVAVTVEVAVSVPAVPKALNAILEAVTVHVPVTVPEAVIVPVVGATAKVLFAVDKSNAELINNNFFNLFIFFYISCLRNIN